MTVAFLSMVLGWSLQRPVTDIAAWLMVMIKRPFKIGDRIIIRGVRGDVLEISPTHILLGEVGGCFVAAGCSGRWMWVALVTAGNAIGSESGDLTAVTDGPGFLVPHTGFYR